MINSIPELVTSNLDSEFQLSSYDFLLPEENIAQEPAANRDESRLLHVDCRTEKIADHNFSSILDLIEPKDLLVVNNTRVFPARLFGRKETGGKIELLLLQYPGTEVNDRKGFAEVEGLLKGSKRAKPGAKLLFGHDLEGRVKKINNDATVLVELFWKGKLEKILEKYGNVPLPPYIRRTKGTATIDKERYQTVYADQKGAVAAPTAGLHFTKKILDDLAKKGVEVAQITLHVGYGTFSPVRVENIRNHQIHAEYFSVPKKTVELVAKTRGVGGKIWAVGTTTTRALEFASDNKGGVIEKQGSCNLYIYPGFEFKVVDNLITNFHLPKSSLLFMVSAFAGCEIVMSAYQEALKFGYRFYSYGDAMVLMNGKTAERR